MFSTLTSLKDISSPRNEDIVYGVLNRPTDYLSSSSYKPEESDEIDRKIQANIHPARKNSDICSADDMDESSRIDDTQNTSRSSSSSSSDTSQRGDENLKLDQNEQQHQQPPAPVGNLNDKNTTQQIKSHLVSTSHDKIAQNILLSEPEAPILKQDVKFRQMQESLCKDEMKNHEIIKPKEIKKCYRIISDAPKVSSSSKRKLFQPIKIVSIKAMLLNQPKIITPAENLFTQKALSTSSNVNNTVLDTVEMNDTTKTQRPLEENELNVRSNFDTDESLIQCVCCHEWNLRIICENCADAQSMWNSM